MSRSRALFFAVLSAALSACGSTAERHPAVSAVPQSYPLVTASGDTAGWLIARHDPWNLDLQFVMNPGYDAAGAVVCPAENGWTTTDSCGWTTSTVAPVRQASMTIALPELNASPDSLCDAPILLEASVLAVGATASSPAWANAWKGRFAFAFTCDPAPQFAGCVRDAKSWAATATWPVNAIALGGAAYKRDELVAMFGDDTTSDASILLLRAFAAAKLNEAAGATAPAAIDAALGRADAWAAKLGTRVPAGLTATPDFTSNGDTWDDGVATASILDRFNEGAFGPATCH